LGYPISPFGVSHFTFWGIFSAHLRTTYSPDARFGFFVFAAKACVFSFQYKKIDPLILLQKYLYSKWQKKEKVFISLCNNQQTNRIMNKYNLGFTSKGLIDNQAIKMAVDCIKFHQSLIAQTGDDW
jgi:hypothetical protein